MVNRDAGILLFGSRVLPRVLTYLMDHPGETATFTTVAEAAGGSPESVSRALRRLVTLGVVSRTTARSSTLYAVQTRHPIYNELKAICVKLFGIGDLLRRESKFGPEVEYIFVYGSVAAGNEDPASDVDVMFIGTPDRTDVGEWARAVGEKLGREVNTMTVSAEQLRAQLTGQNAFYVSVARGPKIMLRGQDDDFKQLTRDLDVA